MIDPLLGVFQFPVLYIEDHKHIPCYITAIIDAHLASILWSSLPWTLPLSLLLVCMHSMNSRKAILQPVRHLEVITASNTEEGASCRLKPSSNNQMLMEVIHPTFVSFDRERTSSSTTKQNPHITFKCLCNTSNFLSFKKVRTHIISNINKRKELYLQQEIAILSHSPVATQTRSPWANPKRHSSITLLWWKSYQNSLQLLQNPSETSHASFHPPHLQARIGAPDDVRQKTNRNWSYRAPNCMWFVQEQTKEMTEIVPWRRGGIGWATDTVVLEIAVRRKTEWGV